MTNKIRGNTQILAGTITNAEINASAAISLSKLAEAVIQADGGQAFTADQSMGGFKLTSLGTPTAAGDAATKAYADSIVSGLDVKASVRVATTAAGTLATDFENGDTIDGVVLATGNRILIKDQAAGAENGIYVVNASGAPTRATDADISAEVTGGMFTFVAEGTVNADTGWVLITNDPITLDTTALVFTQFTGVGTLVAGAGLTKTGNTIDVGAGNGISVAADSIAVNLDGTTLSVSGSGLKLADLTSAYILVGNGSNVATGVAVTGDITLSNAGVVAIASGVIVNADINASAAIDFSKMAALTVSRALVSDGSGVVSVSATTSTEIGYVSGVTSAIQTQLNGKQAAFTFVDGEIPSGSINGSNTAFTLANAPSPATSLHVYQNGNRQRLTTDYTLSGVTLTMASAPETGDNIYVDYRY